ncbi:MAG: TetR family transcriptional regulator [Mycetocola reblochoni]|uniref:Transcriptional regulator, TetR family n=2 Tax=Mycetocola reblochoni TaxID=331618 RepID=A0A1R4KE29_9MICO|nr:TetR family transcriptional regulator [Mycetocola reblochoni]SJN42547.1 Transcriptional regulator, TetR family [Mycetocola reblochoni REB411]
MQQNSATERRPRGRPATANPDRVARTALELFARVGFDEATMDDVAAAAGISRRTLFRLFPSKGELVWGGFDDVDSAIAARLDGAVRDGLAATAPRDGLRALRHDLVAALDVAFDERTAPLSAARLRLIAKHPALRAHGAPRLDAVARLLRAPIARALGRPEDDLSVVVGAAVTFSALFAAILAWAQVDESERGEVSGTVDAALRLVSDGLGASRA